MRAGKLGALKLMRSPVLGERVLALQRLVLEDPTLERVPSPAQYKKRSRKLKMRWPISSRSAPSKTKSNGA